MSALNIIVRNELKRHMSEIKRPNRNAENEASSSAASTPNSSNKPLFNNPVLTALRELCDKVDIIDQKVDKMCKEQSRTRVIITQITKSIDTVMAGESLNFVLPIKSEEELQKYETKIATDSAFRKKLMFHFKTKYVTVDKMIRAIHDSVLSKYNASGANNKRPFLELGISKVMKESCTPDEKVKYAILVRKRLKNALNRYYLVINKNANVERPVASTRKNNDAYKEDPVSIDEDQDDDEDDEQIDDQDEEEDADQDEEEDTDQDEEVDDETMDEVIEEYVDYDEE